MISANVNSSHWVVIVDYLREERFRVSPVTQEDSLLGATSGLSNLMPASLGCTTHSMLMNGNCKRFLNRIRHFAVAGSFMRTATPDVSPNTTQLLTRHTRASSQVITFSTWSATIYSRSLLPPRSGPPPFTATLTNHSSLRCAPGEDIPWPAYATPSLPSLTPHIAQPCVSILWICLRTHRTHQRRPMAASVEFLCLS